MKNTIPEIMPDPRTIAAESISAERLSAVLGLEEKQAQRPHPVLMAAAGAILTAGSFAGINHLTDQEKVSDEPKVIAEESIRLFENPSVRSLAIDDLPQKKNFFNAQPSPTAIPVIAAPMPAVVAKPSIKPAAPPPKPVAKPKPVTPAYPSNSTYGKVINTRINDEMLRVGVSKWVTKSTGDFMDDATLRASSGLAANQAFTKNQPIRYRDCEPNKQMTVKSGTSASRIVQELNKHNWPITMEQLVEWNGGKTGLKLVAGYCIRIAK